MEYKIVEAKDSAQALEAAVRQHLEEGWLPLGGVAVGYSSDSVTWWYYQAMVRRAGEDDRGAGQ